jgi:hypothetical protein
MSLLGVTQTYLSYLNLNSFQTAHLLGQKQTFFKNSFLVYFITTFLFILSDLVSSLDAIALTGVVAT